MCVDVSIKREMDRIVPTDMHCCVLAATVLVVVAVVIGSDFFCLFSKKWSIACYISNKIYEILFSLNGKYRMCNVEWRHTNRFS